MKVPYIIAVFCPSLLVVTSIPQDSRKESLAEQFASNNPITSVGIGFTWSLRRTVLYRNCNLDLLQSRHA